MGADSRMLDVAERLQQMANANAERELLEQIANIDNLKSLQVLNDTDIQKMRRESARELQTLRPQATRSKILLDKKDFIPQLDNDPQFWELYSSLEQLCRDEMPIEEMWKLLPAIFEKSSMDEEELYNSLQDFEKYCLFCSKPIPTNKIAELNNHLLRHTKKFYKYLNERSDKPTGVVLFRRLPRCILRHFHIIWRCTKNHLPKGKLQKLDGDLAKRIVHHNQIERNALYFPLTFEQLTRPFKDRAHYRENLLYNISDPEAGTNTVEEIVEISNSPNEMAETTPIGHLLSLFAALPTRRKPTKSPKRHGRFSTAIKEQAGAISSRGKKIHSRNRNDKRRARQVVTLDDDESSGEESADESMTISLPPLLARTVSSDYDLQSLKEGGIDVQTKESLIKLTAPLEEAASPDREEILKMPIVKACIELVTKAVWAKVDIVASNWLAEKLNVPELIRETKCTLVIQDNSIRIEGPPAQVETLKQKTEEELKRLQEKYTQERLAVSCRLSSDDLAHIAVSLRKFGVSIKVDGEEAVILEGEKAQVSAAIEHYETVTKLHMEEVRRWKSVSISDDAF